MFVPSELYFCDLRHESNNLLSPRLVSEKMTILIPRIYGYTLGDGPSLFLLFLILEYIEGKKLANTNVKKLSEG